MTIRDLKYLVALAKYCHFGKALLAFFLKLSQLFVKSSLSTLHPLEKQLSVQFIDLSQEALLLLEEGHCLRDQSLAWCQKQTQTKITPTFQGTSLETLRHRVASSIGITLMPILLAKTMMGFAYLPFLSPIPTWELGLI